MALTFTRAEISQIVLEEVQKAITEDKNFRYWLIGLLNEAFPSRMELQQVIQQIHEETDRKIAAYREETRQEIAAYREESERRLEAFRQEMAAHREEVQRQLEAFRQEMAALRSEFQQEMAALRSEFQQEMAALRSEFQQEMANLRSEFQQEMAALRSEFQQEMANLRSEFQQEMAALRSEFQQEMAALREDFNRQMATQRSEFQQAIGRLEATLGALGARWGMMAEEAFRSGMAGILKDRLGWEVERFLAPDPEGFVFGHSDQVEIDVVIHNSVHWLVEIRSSMSKPDMYTFVRKVAFYERLRQVRVDRRIVISPMIHPQAMAVAREMGIEVYTSVYDVS